MKYPLIIIGAIILIPTIYFFTRHTPTQWEIATQIVAHNGDTTNALFAAMKEFDSVALSNGWNPTKDYFMSKYFSPFYRDWLKNNPESVRESYEACQRWSASAYSFTMNYYATCQGLGYNVIVFADHKIYPIKISWWKRSLPPTE